MREVFLVKKGGNVLVFFNQADMLAAGFPIPDKVVTEEEFNSSGCYTRIIDGKIVVGFTDEERQMQSFIDRIAEIDEQLTVLDDTFLTPRVLSGLSFDDTFAIDSRNKHGLKCIPLRAQRESLQKQLNALMG